MSDQQPNIMTAAPAESKPRKEKVAIVGFAPTWPGAPFDDESYEIWACNEFHILGKRIDVLFELHSRREIENKERDKVKQEHLNWLRQAKIPIMMIQHFDDIPNSVPYPKDHIMQSFGDRFLGKGQKETYFTNTISWQIAMAIDLGFKQIDLWGVNMANDEEYASQRPSVEYFVGLARGMGIKVFIPDESDICKSWTLYGFDDEQASVMAKRLTHLEQEKQGQRQQFEAQVQNSMFGAQQSIGWISAISYIKKAFIYPNATFNEVMQPPKKEG